MQGFFILTCTHTILGTTVFVNPFAFPVHPDCLHRQLVMNTLKMIVDQEPWVAIKSKTKYEDIPKDEKDHNGWWYLHGKLDEFVGYDKATTTNCHSAGYSKQTVNWAQISGTRVDHLMNDGELLRWEMCVDGIIPVEIEGIDKPCIGYFWTTDHHNIIYNEKEYPYWMQRGLVCFEDDEKGREDALKKYYNKAKSL